MIDRSVEEQMLQHALRQGYLTQQDVDDHTREARWGPLFTSLLYSGILSEALAERLLDLVTESSAGEAPSEDGGGPAAGSSLSAGERYQLSDLIGHGGMGTVYRAYDQSLKRAVAMKFLRSEDPALVERFLREAQVQAQIDHEHVCRVYDVGELEGRAYIAMQLIEGQPLFVAPARDGDRPEPSPALQKMSIEQKVRIIQQVAEGIHAAHRAELIHRDIKPSNIMLEPGEDGRFKPYVLDFGLARTRKVAEGGASLGLVAGTPNFMAPEQAQGESAVLDRRTDVYGLGATLYALLSGRPPFEGPTSQDVLRHVVHDDAPRLENVPEDLATIVAKSLDRDPVRRYESARALAEDLGRYLDGDPIHARSASLVYRLRKKARKHRKLVAVGAVALAAFVTLTAVSVRAQLRARQQARLAGVFGQEVKTIESVLRIAHLAPEHDIRREKAAIREKMAGIDAQVARLGSVASGPGHYAIGRGHLALQEYDDARRHLEQAWSAGYREREVAYALGQVLGAFYQRGLGAARLIGDSARREEKMKQAEREYRDPALAYLRQGRGLAVDSPEYVEALLAFHERRYPDALKRAQEAYGRQPWLHEARGLEARILTDVGRDESVRGRVDDAMESFSRAEAAYRAAMVVGRSDETLPYGLCRMYESIATLNLYGSKLQLVEPAFEKGIAACDHSLRLDPDNVPALNFKGFLYGRMAETLVRANKDPREMLDRRIEVGRRVVAIDPDNAVAYQNISSSLVKRADWEERSGGDGVPLVREAIAVLDKTIALDPRSPSLLAQGVNYVSLARMTARRGEDPRPVFRKAEEFYKRATDLPWYQEINLTLLYLTEAYWDLDHGQDPRPVIERALETGRKAMAFDPKKSESLSNMAEGYELKALSDVVLGGDPEVALAPLVAQARGTLGRDPADADAFDQLASVAWVRGTFALKEGRSPEPAVREGLEQVAAAQRAKPDAALANEARLALLEARWRSFQGLSSASSVDRAERAIAAILVATPNDLPTKTLRLEGLWLRARSLRGASTTPAIAQGLALAGELLAVNPRSPRVLALRGALYLEQARVEGSRRDRALLTKARESLEQALEGNRFLEWEYGTLLEQARKADRG